MTLSSGRFSVGADDAKLTVQTTKAGVGAKLAHNLTLEAASWHADIDLNADDPSASTVTVVVAASSLSVVDFSGGVKPLSDSDREDIAKNINDKALRTKDHPEITFRSTGVAGQGGTFTVTGDLTIVGTTRPINVAVTLGADDQVSAAATVTQTAFGIKPYSAMLGALKINDDVEVRATLTLPAS